MALHILLPSRKYLNTTLYETPPTPHSRSLTQETPMDHWPNLISIILDNSELLNQFKQPLYYFDQVSNCAPLPPGYLSQAQHTVT